MLDDPALRRVYPHDPGGAQALLREAGWMPGADGIRAKDGQRLEIVLNAIEYGGGTDPVVPLIQDSLREVGIDVKIKAQARPPWYEENYRCATHGPVMFLRSIDPDGLYSLFHSSLVGSNFNWSCVKNASLDQLLEQGRRESDPPSAAPFISPSRSSCSTRRSPCPSWTTSPCGPFVPTCRAPSTTSTRTPF